MGYHPFDYVIYTVRLHPASGLTLSLSLPCGWEEVSVPCGKKTCVTSVS